MTEVEVETVIIHTICPSLHLSEAAMISPVLNADGTYDGLIGSGGNYCNVCDKPCEQLAAEVVRRTFPTPEVADCHRLIRQEV